MPNVQAPNVSRNIASGKGGWRKRRAPLAVRLFLAFGVPSAVVVGGVTVASSIGARDSISDSLRREVKTAAKLGAGRFNPDILAAIEPGREDERTYRTQREKLAAVAAESSSTRAFILDARGLVVVDSAGKIPVGSEAPRVALDRRELDAALSGVVTLSVPFSADADDDHGARGEVTSSVDKRRFWRAYGPILHKDDQPSSYVLAIEAPLAVLDEVERVRGVLFGIGFVFVALTLALAVVVARTISRPLLKLAEDAARVGEGDFARAVFVPKSGDEIAMLARTLEEMRQGLKTRDEERQMMLAGIAHEVRNPLGGMELFSGLVDEGLRELPTDVAVAPESIFELVEQNGRVRRELRDLTGVVNDFLAFARETEIRREMCDVDALLTEVVSLKARVGGPDVDVVSHVGAFPLDRGRIKEAVLNVVENALQASAPDGAVSVDASLVDDELVVSVKDRGRGIEPEKLEAVFQPFFTTREKGSGLGLPLVRKFTRDHGGECTLESTVDVGTTVTLRIPRGKASDFAPIRAAPEVELEGLLGDG